MPQWLTACVCCSMSLHGSRRHQGDLDSLEEVPVKRGHSSAGLHDSLSGLVAPSKSSLLESLQEAEVRCEDRTLLPKQKVCVQQARHQHESGVSGAARLPQRPRGTQQVLPAGEPAFVSS